MKTSEPLYAKGVTLQQPQPAATPFGEFLAALFQALDREQVRFCILRNHQDFPDKNLGNDVDILIRPPDLQRSMRALRSLQGIRIVGYSARSWVAHAYVQGTSSTAGYRSLQIDIIWNMNWKGMPYLPTDVVLQTAIQRQAKYLSFLTPSAASEAVSSLLASMIVGGFVKEKYFAEVREVFASAPAEVLAILVPLFGPKAASQLVDSVKSGDIQKVRSCVKPLRSAVAFRNLRHWPLRSLAFVYSYYVREFAVRFSPKHVEAVCILGPNGVGKTANIKYLIPILQAVAKMVEERYIWPSFPFVHETPEIASSDRSSAPPPDSRLGSMTKIVRWLLQEWINRFVGKKNETVRVYERYYPDLFIDPQRYGYRGPLWFARLVGKLFPSPDLWILLDPGVNGQQGAQTAEMRKQMEAYRAFVKTRKHVVILDASRPAASVAEDAYAAIIDALAQRAARKLESRFPE